MFAVIPAEIKPEKAPEIRAPEYSTEVRNPNSARVYQQLR